MSEFEEKLNTLLNDPESMGQIMRLAQNLSGGESGAATEDGVTENVPPVAPGVDPQILQKFLPVLRELQAAESGEAACFLRALRPYLRPEKQEKVEKAISIARAVRIGKTFFRRWEENGNV